MKTRDDKKPYDEIEDLNSLKHTIEAYLNEYNASSKVPLDLVIFGFVCEHVSRICRIIKQPKGNGLLIGIGGTGR